jgi:hypothetical protein
MGNVSLPSLEEIAKYCDCLESLERFNHHPDPTEKSDKVSEQREETPKKQQPRRMPQHNA